MATWRQAAEAINSLLAPVLSNVAIAPRTKVFVGWPEPNQVLNDLRQQIAGAFVSIYPWPGSKLTSRYNKEPASIAIPTTETITVNGLQVTFGGAATGGDNLFLFFSNRSYGIHSQANSTPTSLAANMAAAINADPPAGVAASSVGALVTLSGPVVNLFGRVTGRKKVLREILRTTRRFMVSVWCADPDARETIGETVLDVLCAEEFLTFSDTSLGRILYHSSTISDSGMAAGIAKHDYYFDVEYAHYTEDITAAVGAICSFLVPLVGTLAFDAVITVSDILGVPTQVLVNASAHTHVWNETPAGSRPGTLFTLAKIPDSGTELIVLNGILQKRVGSAPGVNEYIIAGATFTMGLSVGTSDFLSASYEI